MLRVGRLREVGVSLQRSCGDNMINFHCVKCYCVGVIVDLHD
jgi:hypothetical protein